MFTLPKLNYAYNALEPWIDEQTMLIHHTKHHKAYVDKLNAALEKYPEFTDWPVEKLITNLGQMPEAIQLDVKNQGGGHYNHSFFWETLTPAEKFQSPNAKLLQKIEADFQSFENFQQIFKDTALRAFGSGWTWLTVDDTGKLLVASSPNQDNPIMLKNIPNNPRPILGLDIWEHAYYLKYQNKRADYIDAFWNIVNWDKVWYIMTNK